MRLLFPLRLPRRSHRLGYFDRHIPLFEVDLAEGDAAVEFPLVFGAVDADVVDARADDEADGAAAVVEGAAVAGVDGRVDAIGAGDEVEGRHYEADAPIGFDPLRHEAFEVGVRAVHAGSIGVVAAEDDSSCGTPECRAAWTIQEDAPVLCRQANALGRSYNHDVMTKVQALESEIQNLTSEELAEFRSWFADYDGEVWDRQIEADSKAGKFDQLSAEALAEFDRGETTEL